MATYTWVSGKAAFNDINSWKDSGGSTIASLTAGGHDLSVGGSAQTMLLNSAGGIIENSLTLNSSGSTLNWTAKSTAMQFTAGVTLTAGTITMAPASKTMSLTSATMVVNGGSISIGSNATDNIATTLSIGSGGSVGLASGALNIGTAPGAGTGQIVIASSGVGTIDGGTLTATTFNTTGSGQLTQSGGTITTSGATTFAATESISAGTLIAASLTVSGGKFEQSGGLVTNSGIATFSGGTDTFSGTAVFKASAINLNTAITVNGGTIQSTSATGISVNNIAVTMGGGTLDAGTNSGTIGNTGTISGTGRLIGNINGAGGTVTATSGTVTGGTLTISNNVASTNTLNVLSDTVLKLDGTVGANVNLGVGTTTGKIEFGNSAALTHFTGSIANLDIGNSATSVTGFEFINLQGVTVAQVKIGGVATHIFNGSANTVELYSDAAGTSLIQTLTLSSAPTIGTYLDWMLDSAVNGGVLGGTDVFLSSVMCYAAGTAIMTDHGEMPVESLAEGDMVVTMQDGVSVPMPVKWMGVRTIDIANHPQPHTVAPIRIRAGAFAADLPRRDLLVSPAHAIYIDGKLVPANLLINHMSIVQDLHTKSVTYHHVELDRHALILAEGLTSESYLDTGNRAYFANAGLATILHPEFHTNAGLKTWEEDACAPLAVDAEIVTPIWQTLANRAEMLGYVPPRFTTTNDADLYIEANGRRLRPIAVANGRHTFMLPAGASDIVLKSRTSAPADLDPRTGDWRPLGVAVRGMTLRTGDDHIAIPADHPGLVQGWHTAEASNGSVWRWTAGNAAIPMAGTTGPAMLDIEIGAMGTYILARSDRQGQQLAA
jgi:antigen 43